MRELCDGESILYSADPKSPALTQHCAAGGRVIFTSHQDVDFATPMRVLDVEAFAA